jgi:isoleucyl-tRNA synthetase
VKEERADQPKDNGQAAAPKSDVALREEATQAFWGRERVFEETVEREAPKGDAITYDGPPFATGTPHFGHLLPTSLKDAIPRYLTMRGYRVRRRWGWDCHGVPIETLIQKELDLKTKADIERVGIATFNRAARDIVMRYDAEWRKVIPRVGRWVDMAGSYKTMDPSFMEGAIWAFGELSRKGLTYEGFKSVHVSPALETPLSNFEVAQAYKDIDDLSATVRFPVVGEPGVYFLAWTTTPWTLPGNVALAVNPALSYAYVQAGGEIVVVAEALVAQVMGAVEHTVTKVVSGAELVGKRYEAPFPEAAPADKSKLWRVFAGDFVTAEDGTGIVHIAPAFGEDDLNLAEREGLPLIQHVGMDGVIRGTSLPELDGRQAKPASDPAETDVEVIKLLAARGRLFSKKKFRHSYPHCWRTGVPLLNYALSSWFVRVSELRDRLAKLNDGVHWVPESIGKNRFGNWLRDAKDWSVSRARYWGTPIPVWKAKDGETIVVGSLDELRRHSRSTNTWRVMRHGEAESNARGIVSQDDRVKSSLTEAGHDQAAAAAAKLAKAGVTKIYCSPLLRTRETAEVVRAALGLPTSAVIVDDRLKEIQTGIFSGRPIAEYRAFFDGESDPTLARFEKRPEGGETLVDVRQRVGEFLYEADAANDGESILVVAHEYVTWMLDAVAAGATPARAAALKVEGDYLALGGVKKFDFAPVPHDERFELDYHRPYIDDVVLRKNGKEFRRVTDVFDTWFDSGSVPFASQGFPSDASRFDVGSGAVDRALSLLKLRKDKGFPAEYIAEGLDQTRGWFYTLLVLSGALFGKAPYKNVVVNGLILAEDGRKMSKSLNNYPPLAGTIDRYGADAIRFFLLSTPSVRGEEAAFTEKGVDEVAKKLVARLENCLAFYLQSAGENWPAASADSPYSLDRWMAARVAETAAETARAMDAYEIDRAVRPILPLIDDLSNWFLRRSRDRMREGAPAGEKSAALATMRWALLEISKILAPFAPFIAEHLYQTAKGPMRSVHLEPWPEHAKPDAALLARMAAARDAASRGLQLRSKAGHKVRQPLALLAVRDAALFEDPELVAIVRDEVNVKAVARDASLSADEPVWLDDALTSALRREGVARELIRFVQDKRKEIGLEPKDRIALTIDADADGRALVEEFRAEITSKVNAHSILWNAPRTGGDVVGEEPFKFKVGVSL